MSAVMVALAFCTGCAVELPTGEPSDLGAQVGGVADAAPRVAVASMNETRNVPAMVWAGSGQARPRLAHPTPEAAAREYLERHAALYRLPPAALRAVYVHRIHDTGQGGIIVFFRQRVAGIEVVRNELKVLMTRDLDLVALTGSLHDGVEQALAETGDKGARGAFRFPPASAVSSALGDLYGLSLAGDIALHEVGSLHSDHPLFDLAPDSAGRNSGISLVAPARVTPVYFPEARRLAPAWSVELLAERDGQESRRGYEYVIDANEGVTLQRRSRLLRDAYSYRVWADPDGTPRDGPQEDATPHPTGTPDAYEPAFTLPANISVDGLIRPQDGVDSWLPVGADHTSGNNVWAYADHFDPDGYTSGSDRQAFVAPGTRDFHFDYEPTLGPLERASQTDAAVVQLFYATNWLHDDFYVSGFNEAAGNAQNDNLGRGGLGGDALLAEAQNLGPNPQVRNNAAIYVPADGRPPRMEMYLWEMPEARSFRVAGVEYATGRALFGRQTFHLDSLRLVLASGGAPPNSLGCQALTNDVTGAIVLADRGTCTYELKAVNAENAGAAGLIVINHTPGAQPPDMLDVDPSLSTNLPVLSISHEAGQALKALLANGATAGTMARLPEPERDGTLDNTVIAHEWGHLLHHRLVDCGEPQCDAQSEGWGDFIALHMMVRENDSPAPDGTYAIGGYASHILGQSPYYGIRRAPYSRSPSKNGLRFRHVSDAAALPEQHPFRDNGEANSEVHNAGEIWASMLFDGYLALLDEARKPDSRFESFAAARRRMADYVVAGMMLAPVDPSFTEQRDALLMAAMARDPRDMRLLAEAFAGRGAGTCAVSPPRRSLDFTEVKEGTDVRADLRLAFVRVADDIRSCDAQADGILDADEVGALYLQVTNLGPVPSSPETTVRVQGNRPVVSLPPDGVPVPSVPPFDSILLPVPIELTGPLEGPRDVEFTTALIGPDSCQESTEQKHLLKLDHDLAPSASDGFEGNTTTWHTLVLEGGSDQVWRRVLAPSSTPSAVNHLWFVEDGYDFADTVLVSPPLQVAASGPFRMTFDHRHHFAFELDSGTGRRTYWNGGVIEVTQDDGLTWEDVSVHAAPGYEGTLDTTVSNNLRGRQAYVAKNPAWPGMDVNTVLDFGTKLAGKRVRLRFRFGSAWFAQAYGWEVDNIRVSGVTTGPFEGIVEDAGSCRPVADAGADRTASFGEQVTLDGSGSSEPNHEVLRFSWEQVQGPPVVLRQSDPVRPRFVVPTIADAAQRTLRFRLSVTDGTFTATDTVTVEAKPPAIDEPPEPQPITGGGGGCTHGAADDAPARAWPFWLLGTAFLMTRARAR